MAKYYFHIREGGVLIADDEGLHLSDIGAARAEAWLSAGDLLAASYRDRRESRTQTIELADEFGNILDVMAARKLLN